MAHNFPKISAPFGRATPKDRLVDTTIFAKSWVQMFYDNKNKIIYVISKEVDKNEKLISQLEEWRTYDENNFVILCKWKTDDDSSWYSYINGYEIKDIKGTMEYRFEKINDTKMKVIPQDKHWFIVEKE